ncbi:ComEC/Rec2 family competence protein [Nitratifractor sp.]
MAPEPVPLLEGRREWGGFLLLVALLFSVRIGGEYLRYREFRSLPFFYTEGTIERLYPPRLGRPGRIAMIRADRPRSRFFTRVRQQSLRPGMRLRLALHPPKHLGFVSWIRGPYIPSRIRRILPPEHGLRRRLLEAISSQHSDPGLATFYRALFLADPPDPGLRKRLSRLGASHLLALSGFHLGILGGLLFALLGLGYRPLQRRFFPWRHARFDLGIVVLALLGGFVAFVGAPPSLLRSYAMALMGWIALIEGVALFSFGFLAFVALGLVALFPDLLLRIGFWLSVAGVFAIDLLLLRFPRFHTPMAGFLLLPPGVFLLMIPIVHSLFGTVSPWQWLSPVLSILFVPFYPLAIVLHLLGQGGILDPWLRTLFELPVQGWSKLLPPWILPLYGISALAAVRTRRAFLPMGVLILGSAIWLYL